MGLHVICLVGYKEYGKEKQQERDGTGSLTIFHTLGLPLFSAIEPKGKIHTIILSPQGEEMMSVLLGLHISPRVS